MIVSPLDEDDEALAAALQRSEEFTALRRMNTATYEEELQAALKLSIVEQ